MLALRELVKIETNIQTLKGVGLSIIVMDYWGMI